MTMPETARKRLAIAGLSLSAFVAFLDFAIVNTALPSIQRDLTLTFVQLQWVMNIFVLALCIFMVNMGRFGDIFGRRVLLYTGLACFAAASLSRRSGAEWSYFDRGSGLSGICHHHDRPFVPGACLSYCRSQ